MAHQNKRQISGEVFSAKAYFEQCASGAAHPDGRQSFTKEMPERGVWQPETHQCSLIWIDGIFGDSLALERFFSSLRSGEVPAPISGLTSRPVNWRTRHTSPTALVASPRTILAACGFVDVVTASAQRALHTRCAGCNALLTRYHSPLSVLDAITKDRSGKTVSIYAESDDPRLAEWATSRGLRIDAEARGLTSVYLDRTHAGTTVDTSVGTLVHSLWRIPHIRFTTCESTLDTPTQSYSSSGWCETCGVAASPILPAKLRELLTYGLHDPQTTTPEALIALTPSLTVKELLLKPLGTLLVDGDTPLRQLCELLTRLSLSTCALGTPSNTLDARDLAKLSIIASIPTTVDQTDQIIIDLPRSIIPFEDALTVQKLLEHAGASTSVTVLHKLFSCIPRPGDGSEFKKGSGPDLFSISLSQSSTTTEDTHCISSGSLLRIFRTEHSSHRLFYELTEQITSTVATIAAPVVVAPIPVFSALNTNASVVGEELGLLEPLAQLYAASLDARVHGLTPKDFTLFRTRSPRYICERCRGLGVILAYYEILPRPLATPCPSCRGARCNPPISTALFRRVSFSAILNQPIAQSVQILTALSRAKPLLDMVINLDLHHLPLGMPVALLSTSEIRRLLVVRALRQARRSRPAVILFEAPTVGFSDLQKQRLADLRDASLGEGSAIWIEIN